MRGVEDKVTKNLNFHIHENVVVRLGLFIFGETSG